MSATLGIITVAIAIVIILAVMIVKYMSVLVANAYQLKVDLRAELDGGLRRLDDEVEKKAKEIRRDLFDEAARLRSASDADAHKRLTEHAESLKKHIADLEAALRNDHEDMFRAVQGLRRDTDDLQDEFRNLKRRATANAAHATGTKPPPPPI